MLKKLTALLLAAVLLLSMAACTTASQEASTPSNSQNPQTNTTTEPAADPQAAPESTEIVTSNNENAQAYSGELPPAKLGFICWGYTDSLAQGYVRALEYAGEYCGFEIEYASYSNYEEIITAAENLIQAGCNILMTTKASAALMDLCESNQVYLAQWASVISDPELAEYMEKSKYWVGVSTVDDYDAGYQCVETLYEAGCRNIVLMGSAAGSYSHDLRFMGMYDALETHEDVNVLGEFRSSTLKTEAAPSLQNYIALYPELDGVISSGASSGILESIVQTLDTEGKIGKIKFATVDIQAGCDAYFEEGSLSFIAGGQYLEVMFLMLNALNIYDGAYDGSKQIDTTFLYLKSAEDYRNYVKYIDSDGVYPYSAEELQSITWRCNPDATFQDLYDMWSSYSLETIVEKIS